MKALVFEQWNGGHYTNYLQCLVPEVARVSDEVVLAVDATMRQTLSDSPAVSSLRNVTFAPDLPPVGPSLRPGDRLAATRNLLDSLRTVRPDYTLLPSADAQTAGMVLHKLRAGRELRALGPIEGTFHYGYGYAAAGVKERLKEWVYSATYRGAPYDSVNFVNFAYYEYAQGCGLIEPDRLRFVGDPVPQPERIGREAARRLLGLDPVGRYVGLFGVLDRRKAVPELLAAFRRADLAASDRLVLGGRLDPTYAELIATEYADLVRAGRIVVIDRFLTGRELESAYEALDVATVVYYRFPGLASLALKAVAAGTPVLAHDFGWLRALVRRFEVGVTTDIFDPARFASDLRRCLDAPSAHASSEAVTRLLRFHEEANFVARMTSGLRRAAGAPATASVEWNWVLEAVPPARRALA